MILLIALVNALASLLGLVVPNVSSGVSSKVSMCVDSGCDDMFTGVGGWDGVLVPGIEFPEGSRKVNRSSSRCFSGVSSGTLGHTMSSRSRCLNILLGVSALHYSTGSTEGSEGFGRWLQLMRCT